MTSNKDAFDLICGTDPGDMDVISEGDIRAMADYWNEQGDGDPFTEEDIQNALLGLEEYRQELRQDEEAMESLHGPTTWTDHTVLLVDGTTGTMRIPAGHDPEALVGVTITVGLHDENGLPIQATGIVAEILE